VCVEGSACLRDVTQRYVTRWSEALARRVQDQDWWAVTLGDLSDPSSPIFVILPFPSPFDNYF